MDDINAQIRAKIPGADTGIEIRHTLCDICTPQMHCGLDVYVKDGKVLKVEGTPDHPVNHGFLCTKGVNNRQYLYRKDRILTPLRRVGKKAEQQFVPISWDEAIEEISKKLLGYRSQYGVDSVAFFPVMENGTGLCTGDLPMYLALRITEQSPAAALPQV